MSIKKRVQNALFFVSIGAIILLMVISMFSFFMIRHTFTREMTLTSQKITADNTHEMLTMSTQLGESTAMLNARRINGNFSRMKGELLTLKGDIENLYKGGGTKIQTSDISRYKEYIVSQKAKLTDTEIAQTAEQMASVTAMFDNVLKNEDNISLAYIVLENGMVFSSTDTFYPEVEKADMRAREWYKSAIDNGDVYWSDLYAGTDKRSYVTLAVPVYHNETVFGVVAFDLRVSEISDVVLNQGGDAFTDAFIMTAAGEVLLSTQNIDSTVQSEAYQTLLNSGELEKNNGCYTDENIIAGYADIEETGWQLVTLLDYNKVLEPVRKVEETVSTAAADIQSSMTNQIGTTITIFIAFLVVLCIFVVLLSREIARKITKPVEILTEGAAEIGSGNLTHVIPELGNDEIGKLAKSFNGMSMRLTEYIDNLTAITAEKERIGAELDVAKHIQASMLPCLFPAFPERPELDIYATMTPAKEVGGDFYDFFLTDDDHLVMVMADVSGKGVPAALFMVIAKTLLKNCAQTGLSPKAILEKVNNQLCENNDAELFVTVWLGILQISTGKLTAANAGHEYPVLKKAGGDYELIKDKHGFVLAGMEGTKYKEYELFLSPGDKLYLYTDGVVEATDAHNELYGTDRMLFALNSCKDVLAEELLQQIKLDIDGFVGTAPQFDDITMLALELRRQNEGMKKLKMVPILENLCEVTAFVEQELAAAEISMKMIMQMNIVVDEIFSNIARYSGATNVTVGCLVQDSNVTLRFADNGVHYDPTKRDDPDTSLSADERDIGGLGIYMVKKSMDSVNYEYHDGQNILVLTKRNPDGKSLI